LTSRLRDRDARQPHRAQRIVEVRGLEHPGGGDYVERLWNEADVERARGSALAVAQTPNWNSCVVGVKLRALSGLKPSWLVRTTTKPQPGPGAGIAIETLLEASGSLRPESTMIPGGMRSTLRSLGTSTPVGLAVR
jgi:hypothetical protein